MTLSNFEALLPSEAAEFFCLFDKLKEGSRTNLVSEERFHLAAL